MLTRGETIQSGAFSIQVRPTEHPLARALGRNHLLVRMNDEGRTLGEDPVTRSTSFLIPRLEIRVQMAEDGNSVGISSPNFPEFAVSRALSDQQWGHFEATIAGHAVDVAIADIADLHGYDHPSTMEFVVTDVRLVVSISAQPSDVRTFTAIIDRTPLKLSREWKYQQ